MSLPPDPDGNTPQNDQPHRPPVVVRGVLIVMVIVALVAALTGLALLRGSFSDIVEGLLNSDDRIDVQIDTRGVTLPSLPTLRPRATLAPILVPTSQAGG